MGSMKGISKCPKEYGMGSALGKTLSPKDIEGEMVENIDLKRKILEIAEVVVPLLKGDAEAGDIIKMLDRASPIAMLELIQLMATTKNEKVKYQAIKDILDRGGYKPVEKSVSVVDHIDRMSKEQLDAYLINSFKTLKPEQANKLMKLIKAPDGSYTTEDQLIKEINAKEPKEI